jgi:hypothetical protein
MGCVRAARVLQAGGDPVSGAAERVGHWAEQPHSWQRGHAPNVAARTCAETGSSSMRMLGITQFLRLDIAPAT